jgi:hypothetical protein
MNPLDVGPNTMLEALFATITYRLEPDGRGSRFPMVMKRLFAGRLPPSEIPAALRELVEIETELTGLPSDRVVWSLSDLRRRDDRELPVNHRASNARDYFVGADGRPLICILREVCQLNAPVKLATARARWTRSAALGLIFFGGVWAVAGYWLLPDWILTTGYETSTDGGPLLWPLGILFAAAGMLRLGFMRLPALEEWFEARVWLSVGLILAVMPLYFVLIWRK